MEMSSGSKVVILPPQKQKDSRNEENKTGIRSREQEKRKE